MWYPSFLALAAFVVSLLGTRLMILALRHRPMFLDKPNARSSHSTPVPRAGGVAVVTTLVMYFIAADINFAFILAIIVLAGISMLDDLISIHPIARLVAHFLTVLAMIQLLNIDIFDAYMPHWLGVIVISIGWVWFINLFNFMDGIDGITASECVAISFGIILVLIFADQFTEGLAYHAIILAGAMGGFWWWNRHPAKIFLGDVGSITVGFVLGYFLLELTQEGYGIAAAILPAYYIMDASVTLMKRLLNKKKIWVAHREHFYQQAANRLGRHDKVTHMITGLNLILIMLAVLSSLYPEIAIIHLVVAYGISGVWALTFARIGAGKELPPL